jgi:hypothetical protein
MMEYWNSGMMGQTEEDYELGYIPIYPIFHLSSIPIFHGLDKFKTLI